MEPAFVTIPYTRVLPHPVEEAYAWLTDYQDDDPQRTTAVVKRRPVLSRTKDKVVLEGELEMLGVRGVGTVEVTLLPPDRWVAEIVKGGGKGSVYEYRLTPAAGGGSRLDVRYRVRVRRWSSRLRLLLARPLLRRELDRMWDGFAESMARELSRNEAPTR
ncbi:MAG TPA: SRPBCC family protein [Candidatus Thermoplasmatota archaeon]|nr:SRPBCC family protein [Candidatus Thermoplasmatota archaeon]